MIKIAPDLTPSRRSISTAPVITETVTVTPAASEARAFLGKPDSSWSWSDLRDFVVAGIERCHGVFPRDQKKEYGIFSRFFKEYGPEQSAAIARYAFGPVCNGMWANAPISVNRFTKNSDPYFARPILDLLAAAPEPVTAW